MTLVDAPQAMCKQESAQRPCPRAILICCTAIVSSGLYEEGIFKDEAPSELVHYLLGAFEEGKHPPPCMAFTAALPSCPVQDNPLHTV